MKVLIFTLLTLGSFSAFADKALFDVEVGVSSSVLDTSFEFMYNLNEKLAIECSNLKGRLGTVNCKTTQTPVEGTEDIKAIATACSALCFSK
jgi:hypothetical protein